MKVMLLDTGFSALPIYEHLVAQGHEVWAMGNRPHDAIARKAGKHWIAQDYSRIAEVSRHADRLGIERLVPGCTDVSILTCTAIAGGDGRLDRAKTNSTLADKQAFRVLCAELDLPAPRAISSDHLPCVGRFICKPVDAFSGRGISVFDGRDEGASKAALVRAGSASPSGQVLVEPFIEGQLYSWSAFIEKGQAKDAFFVREGSSADRFAVDTSFVDDEMPGSAEDCLRSAIDRIARALDLVDGLIHTQFIWTGADVSIVEITRRCPGDLYARLIEYSTGFAYAAKYTSYFIGDVLSTAASKPRPTIRHTVTSLEDRVFAGLAFAEALPVRAFFPLAPVGEPLAAGHAARIAVLFAETADTAARDRLYDRFLARRVYQTI